ncbi:hypothetical protein KPH14_001070 [Odynerus spinipes]|uniref:Uncharacterized protein n=1 Tax=Odynerus spinipes TaxID=1348599 RepID=A0AAD9RE63_9HYME|nr:hypothetical protein KPH14_001070 [Odynerus spinipes]
MEDTSVNTSATTSKALVKRYITNRGKRSRAKLRQEQFRERIGDEVVRDRHRELDQKYLLDNVEELEALLQREIAYAKQLQVSTRGVGLTVVATATSVKEMRKPPTEPVPVFPLYRVILSFVTEKMALVLMDKRMTVETTEFAQQFYADSARRSALATWANVPTVITAYYITCI